LQYVLIVSVKAKYLLQNTHDKKMTGRTKLFIFNALFLDLLDQDTAIGSDKCPILTSKTGV
jgi:hypothetical protein